MQLDAKRSANVLIVGNFEPFTLSCVTLVQLNEPDLEGLFVLKLYDRRFAIQMRKEAEAPPWCSGIESGYRQFVNAGGASNFFDSCTRKIREDEYWTHDYRENQDNSECEAYMQWLCHRIYDTEMKAYDKLRDIQGKHVPKLVARPLLKNSSNSSWSDIYLDCPRLLLEYIKGFPLTDLADFAPQDRWQSVCEEAIHIIHQIGDRGILNKDVNTRSFIVQIDPVSQKLRVCTIDFGLCLFRCQFKSDSQVQALAGT